VEESKGKRDRRTVLLSDVAFDICQRLALKHPEGAIFRDRRGKPWTATALDRECEKLSKLVGFHLTPYMVRHTFATRKILAGVDLITIAALMGHRNLNTLSRVYAHVMRRQDHLRAALNKLA
jgi:integrase